MRDLKFENIDVEFRQDYLNLNKLTAISAEGFIFKVGDVVCHDGSENEGEIATISKFTVDLESFDVIAHTEKGFGRISFMYHPN